MLDNHAMHNSSVRRHHVTMSCKNLFTTRHPLSVSSVVQYRARHCPRSAELACPLLLPNHDQVGNEDAYLQAEEFLKRYLEYCRVKCSPRLTQRAAATLVTDYVEIRDEVNTCIFVCMMLAREIHSHIELPSACNRRHTWTLQCLVIATACLLAQRNPQLLKVTGIQDVSFHTGADKYAKRWR